MKKLGLYIHIPFCKHKCEYCDFYSVVGFKDTTRYTDSLLLQMEDFSKPARDYEIDSVFIGGGTPTVMPVRRMLELIDGIYVNFKVLPDCEFSMEANPATVDINMLKKYRKAGVNRISFGLQSANDRELENLTRIHNFEQFRNSFYMARRAGFENINVDVMYGIPNQSESSLHNTLSKVCELDPEHISLYGLKIEDGTPFAQKKDSLTLPDEDTEYRMYIGSINYLSSCGYKQYEISNFAKPGKECKHNLKYWTCEEYLGFGPAAHSYFNGRRFSYKKDVGLFMDSLEYAEKANDILDENYNITQSERVDEYIMLNLRLNKGLDVEDFKNRFGKDFEKTYEKELKLYTANDFMKKLGSRYSFTAKGMYVSNYILSSFLTFESDIAYNIANGTDK